MGHIGSSTKMGVKGGKQAEEEKRMQDRKGKGEKGTSLYIPMHQSGFEECVSCLMQKRTASNRSPTPLKPVLSSSLKLLRFPGSNRSLGEHVATPLQPARP